VFIKQVIASFFLLAFTMQTFNTSFVVYNYYANTSAYAKNCINKSKPKLHCNGKCQMMKKLQQEEKKEQQNQDSKTTYKILLTLSSKSFFATAPTTTLATTKIIYPLLNGAKEIKIATAIFRPPCCA
jgi:hypothetical protein